MCFWSSSFVILICCSFTVLYFIGAFTTPEWSPGALLPRESGAQTEHVRQHHI